MAGLRNITIYKGDSYLHEVRIKNAANTAINISGRSYRVQMRKSKASREVILSFDIAVVNAANGIIRFSLEPEDTANIPAGTYYYDFEETNLGYVTTLMGGKMVITGEVSRG
jgi:hypothetical protein